MKRGRWANRIDGESASIVAATRVDIDPGTVEAMQAIGREIVAPNARLVRENAAAFRAAAREFLGPLAKTAGGVALIALMGLAELDQARQHPALGEG